MKYNKIREKLMYQSMTSKQAQEKAQGINRTSCSHTQESCKSTKLEALLSTKGQVQALYMLHSLCVWFRGLALCALCPLRLLHFMLPLSQGSLRPEEGFDGDNPVKG